MEVSLDKIEPIPNASRPFVSFGYESEANKNDLFYVQGEHFEDKELLQKLLGRSLTEHEIGVNQSKKVE
eukprot:CAMPEP_0171454762 /NCGR_PEP_ID=MMETSP0945-20130129/1924_1 /TAXON_ID=109269 /ORGANISM="Vaucheria litorea, Strain CCMP2940" /LENGTH=68 /DNA_ID=CAMNT_0011979861 /DNA_START=420 /DNA_END=629 /DNA_ORIENTATION=+